MHRPVRAAGLHLAAAGLLASLSIGPVLAQTAPPSAATPLAANAPAANDPILAKVNGEPIRLSDVQAAAAGMPPAVQSMPPQTLFPMLLRQMIDDQALLLQARRDGLDKDPDIQKQMREASDQTLETALLRKEIAPLVTEATVRARYDADVAKNKGQEEVHARQIVVADEATARSIIAQLAKGAAFEDLWKQYDTNHDAGANGSGAVKGAVPAKGGDMGFFKKSELPPEFAKVEFALQPGQVTRTPLHSQYGWHVIQVLERRPVPVPTFEQAAPELQQAMIHEALQKVTAQARAQVKIETFNPDGSPARATDSAEPPPNK
jgi:peptidyl-prolyl cis-trans isomerase C